MLYFFTSVFINFEIPSGTALYRFVAPCEFANFVFNKRTANVRERPRTVSGPLTCYGCSPLFALSLKFQQYVTTLYIFDDIILLSIANLLTRFFLQL